MTANFEIEDNYAIIFNGCLLDLHNDYNFEGLQNDSGGALVAKFTKDVKYNLTESGFQEIHFKFYGVNYKFIKKGIADLREDQGCLGEISFIPSDLRQENDIYLPRSKPNKNDDLLMHFEDEAIIRIGCDKIVVEGKY